MNEYRDDLQAATARAEAAEKALMDTEKMIDARVWRAFKVVLVSAFLATPLIFGVTSGGPPLWRWLFDSPPAFVCGPGGNGGDVSIEAGAPGLGCDGLNGVSGKIYIGDKMAKEINIGHEGGVTVLDLIANVGPKAKDYLGR